jgi:hypothetical protein
MPPSSRPAYTVAELEGSTTSAEGLAPSPAIETDQFPPPSMLLYNALKRPAYSVSAALGSTARAVTYPP